MPTNMAPVGNNVITSQMTQIFAANAFKNAGFLKIGSRNYFSDQINGKMRTGKSYDFVLPDAGNVAEGLVIDPRTIEERKITLTIKNMNNSVQADALELVTDLDWKNEVAERYAQKLMNRIIKKEVEAAQSEVTTCFVGEGWRPLSKAQKALMSKVDEKVIGFISPDAESIITTNGQAFQVTGSPDFFGKGDVGNFQRVDYTSQKDLVPLKMEQGVINALSAAKAKDIDPDHVDQLGISGVTTAANTVLKAGTPIFVDGAYACDVLGDVTTTPYAFIVKEDVPLSATAVTAKVSKVETRDIGSRNLSTSALGGKAISVPASGTYFAALIRSEGSYDYTPVNTLEFMLSDKTGVGDVEGMKIFANAFTNGTSAVNTVRWDHSYMAGQIDNRCASLIYLKDKE